MNMELTSEQQSRKAEFAAFTEQEIAPHANQFDQQESIPLEVIQKLADNGYLGAILPKENGGAELDMVTYGLLHEEIGRACSSMRSLLTVHDMVAYALLRWGTEHQKDKWLPALGNGSRIAAFGLTEPDTGSDAGSIETEAVSDGPSYVLNGHKKWISFGQVADLFLIIARCNGSPTAFLVEKDTPGFSIEPITGMLGLKASMLAELHLEDCRIPQDNLLCREGFGFSHVTTSALTLGRYSVASGCVGIAQASLDACLHYTSTRKQFKVYLKKHQLVRQMISDMITNVKAARLLCYQVGCMMDANDPAAVMEASVAKYFASTKALQAASDAVQLHGANGCSADYSVQRYFRDAKIMEIIEGSSQIQQIAIAGAGYQEYRAKSARMNRNPEGRG
jgi:alkylation response protein AidB-like acyl-CoA dehydrogenase